MIETICFIVILLAIIFVAMGPKPSGKDKKDPDSTDKR